MAGIEQLDAALTAAIAAAGRGHRGANPLVGACILDESGRIIATGYHRGAGHRHAEIDALAQLEGLDREARSSLSMVVSLEPCNHTGRTGPCSEAIIASGIRRVHYAASDKTAASGGAAALQAAGIKTTQAHQMSDALELNHRWFQAKAENRPFITVKIAQSLDGRISAPDGTSQWITSQASRTHGHQLRARADAILVGTGTVLADNPQLTARHSDGSLLAKQPFRLVMGRRELPSGLALSGDGRWEQIATRQTGPVLQRCAELGISHLLVEGGATVASAFLAAGLADEIYCYQAPLILGAGRSSISLHGTTTLADAMAYRLDAYSHEQLERLGSDAMLHLEPLPNS